MKFTCSFSSLIQSLALKMVSSTVASSDHRCSSLYKQYELKAALPAFDKNHPISAAGAGGVKPCCGSQERRAGGIRSIPRPWNCFGKVSQNSQRAAKGREGGKGVKIKPLINKVTLITRDQEDKKPTHMDGIRTRRGVTQKARRSRLRRTVAGKKERKRQYYYLSCQVTPSHQSRRLSLPFVSS